MPTIGLFLSTVATDVPSSVVVPVDPLTLDGFPIVHRASSVDTTVISRGRPLDPVDPLVAVRVLIVLVASTVPDAVFLTDPEVILTVSGTVEANKMVRTLTATSGSTGSKGHSLGMTVVSTEGDLRTIGKPSRVN